MCIIWYLEPNPKQKWVWARDDEQIVLFRPFYTLFEFDYQKNEIVLLWRLIDKNTLNCLVWYQILSDQANGKQIDSCIGMHIYSEHWKRAAGKS